MPEESDANFASELNKLKEKRFEAWCELVQSLDRKSLSLVKTAKPNGTQTWKHHRIHQLSNKLTNLRRNSQEIMPDYSMRAEELQLNVTDVEENVSDQMLFSVVLKDLPNRFEDS